jgi:DNA mismatch repair protein MutS2
MTIARRLGLPADVLARAESYLGNDERAGLQVMEELNLLKQQAVAEREGAVQLRREAERDRDQRKKLLQESKAQQQELLEKATRRAERLLVDAESRLQAILASARGSDEHDARSRAELTTALHEVRDEVILHRRTEPSALPLPPQEVRLGEILHIVDLRSEGEVTRILAGEVELDCNGKKLRLPLTRLSPCSPRRFASKGGARIKKTLADRPIQSKLLLVGKRMEEALLLLDRALDDALIHGLGEMEIVHGAGEGILRRAVREFLAGHQGIRGFHPAEAGQGGDNVTVVELGD